MLESEHLVCPLGRYGHCYDLDSTLYRIYRMYTASFYALAGIFAALEFLFPPNYTSSLGLSSDFPLYTAIVACALGWAGQILIASRGRLAPNSSTNAISSRDKEDASKRHYLFDIIVYLSGIILITLIVVSMTFRVNHGRPIGAGEAILLIICLFVMVNQYRKQRRR